MGDLCGERIPSQSRVQWGIPTVGARNDSYMGLRIGDRRNNFTLGFRSTNTSSDSFIAPAEDQRVGVASLTIGGVAQFKTLCDALLTESGQPLDGTLRKTLEICFSADFTAVVVHTSPLAAAANGILGSRAFTVGNHIFFGENTYRPSTADGRMLIAHELAHVVQKRLGCIPAGGNTAVDETPAEVEAHMAAARVTQGKRFDCVVPLPCDTPSCWGEAGHYYTSHFVLQAAGVDFDLAAKIAFFAQMADQVLELDATQQGINAIATKMIMAAGRATAGVAGGLVGEPLRKRLTVMKEIGCGLHCLTGAASDLETQWRASLLESPQKTSDELEIGLGVHAFGDSFAHRRLEDEKKMYPPIYGHGIEVIHGFEYAHTPDHADQRPWLYQQYGEELYAIARYRWGAQERLSLGALQDALKQISAIHGDEAQINKIRSFGDNWCKPIGLKYFPELPIGRDLCRLPPLFPTGCVSYQRFMAIHQLPPEFLNRARSLARAWSYLSCGDPPARKSHVSDYADAPAAAVQPSVQAPTKGAFAGGRPSPHGGER